MFNEAVKHVLKHEGGFVHHAADPGGATNMGISLRFLKGVDGDLNNDGVVDVHDILEMTEEQAIELYREHFWNPAFEELQDLVASKVFDMSVNMGERRSVTILQQSVNCLRGGERVVTDGLIGPQTIEWSNRTYTPGLIQEICRQQVKFYESLVDKDPDLGVFLDGWKNRARFQGK